MEKSGLSNAAPQQPKRVMVNWEPSVWWGPWPCFAWLCPNNGPHSVFKKCEGYANILKFSSVQSLSCVWLFETPWIAACQASLSITNSQSLLKLRFIESVMPSNCLLLCRPLLLLPSVFPNIRVFSNESVLRHQVAKVLEFQLHQQSFQSIFRTGFL